MCILIDITLGIRSVGKCSSEADRDPGELSLGLMEHFVDLEEFCHNDLTHGIIDPRHDHDKQIFIQAEDQIYRTEICLQHRSHTLKHPSACLLTINIRNFLEPVNIKQQHCYMLLINRTDQKIIGIPIK